MIKVNNCPVCKCEMWLPDELCQAALKSSKIGFFCAYGHSQHFSDDCIKHYWGNTDLVPKIPTEGTNVIVFQKKLNP